MDENIEDESPLSSLSASPEKSIRNRTFEHLYDERERFWSAKDKLIGRMVEIRADAITQSIESEHFSLRFPRFKNFRGFKEDEKI